MVNNDPRDTSRYNPTVCCAAACGQNCNDCFRGLEGLNGYCTTENGGIGMCYDGSPGQDKCCEATFQGLIIPANRYCLGTKVQAPCRLGKNPYPHLNI